MEAFNVDGNMHKVLVDLPDPRIRHAFRIHKFKPFCPMLAKYLPQINETAKGLGDFAIETKLDGERCVMHFDKDLNVFIYFYF